MRKRPIVILVLLLMLFISSYGYTAILAEPNTVKDFFPAGLEGWSYRRTINITGSAGAGTNYQIPVNITYESHMQADFDDLRFTDNNESTLLDSWLQIKVNSVYAYVWVEVLDDLGTDSIIYMYSGNAGVGNVWNGTDTFLIFEDWATETLRPAIWDINDNDGSVSWDDEDAQHGSVIEIEGNEGVSLYAIETDTDYTEPMAINGRVKLEATEDDWEATRFGIGNVGGERYYIDSSSGTDAFVSVDNDLDVDTDAMAAGWFDSYHIFDIRIVSDHAYLYADYNLIETVDFDNVGTVPAIFMAARDSEYEMYCDWVFARNFIPVEPVAVIDYWNVSGIATLLFSVVFDLWGMNTALIILGLVMIPASTIYLAYGAKHDRSSDRLYYGLIMLFLGFGLLIGGVLP